MSWRNKVYPSFWIKFEWQNRIYSFDVQWILELRNKHLWKCKKWMLLKVHVFTHKIKQNGAFNKVSYTFCYFWSSVVHICQCELWKLIQPYIKGKVNATYQHVCIIAEFREK
jgi:hypothetical protein